MFAALLARRKRASCDDRSQGRRSSFDLELSVHSLHAERFKGRVSLWFWQRSTSSWERGESAHTHTHTVDDKTIQPQRPFKEAVLELLVDLHNLHIKDEKMDESSPVLSRLFVHKKGQIHIQANSSVNSYHSVTFELNATRKSFARTCISILLCDSPPESFGCKMSKIFCLLSKIRVTSRDMRGEHSHSEQLVHI